jgi:hypothetical protein
MAGEEDEPALMCAVVEEETSTTHRGSSTPPGRRSRLRCGTRAGRRCIPAAWRKPSPGLPSSP